MSPAHDGTGALLRLLAQEVTDAYAARLAPHGIRPRHVRLLRAAADTAGASQREIGTVLGLVPSAVVPIVDDLETMGALRRVPDPRDRRRHGLELTPRGRELLEVARQAADAVDADVLGPLPARERRHLHSVLGQLLQARAHARPGVTRPTERAAPDLAGFPTH